jgi:hypothetical protein
VTVAGYGSDQVAEAENTPATNVVYQASATDADNDTIAWSLGGADAVNFAISATGAVTFLASPDYENPADAGGNNFYDVVIQASDGAGGVDTRAAPPIHMPYFFDAAILSRTRSPITSRSNWANDSRMLRVSRPIELVVLNCCVPSH